MKITHRIDNRVCIVTINSDLARGMVDDTNEYIKPLLNDDKIDAMIMDLDQVAFIDSSGLGLIVEIYETLKKREAKFALFHLTKKNQEIFRLTHVNKFIRVYSTEADAIAHL